MLTDCAQTDGANKVECEIGHCVFEDVQVITVQDAPESVDAGQMPTSVDVFLNADFVNTVVPGDRVSMLVVHHLAESKPPDTAFQ